MSKSKKATNGSYRFLQQEKDGGIFIYIYLRQRSGLSPGQIARATGVSETTLRNWEFGSTVRPQHETLRRAWEYLGWKEELHSGSDSMHYDYDNRRLVMNGRATEHPRVDLTAKRRPKIKPLPRFVEKVQDTEPATTTS